MNKVLNHPFQLTTGLFILASSVVLLTLHFRAPVLPIKQPIDTGQSNLGVSSQNEVTIDEPLSIKAIIDAVNVDRAKHNLSPLTEDPRLDSSAYQKATELSQHDYTSNPHINQQGIHGYTYAITAAHCSIASEDISLGNPTTQTTVNAWINSPEHHASMDGNYEMAGVGINGTIVVLHLCHY